MKDQTAFGMHPRVQDHLQASRRCAMPPVPGDRSAETFLRARAIFTDDKCFHCQCGWSSRMEAMPLNLSCPECQTLHVDEGEWATTRLHKTHLCAKCGHTWRPFPFPTVGVAEK